MMKTLRVAGQLLSADFIEELKEFCLQQPVPSRTAMARHVCQELKWNGRDGEPNVAKARDFLGKLDKAGHVKLPPARGPRAGQPRRLSCTGQSLPPLGEVPVR